MEAGLKLPCGVMGMDEVGEGHEMMVYSIGHSNHPFAIFVSLLKKQAIEVLVDVRSHPYSKYSPDFASQAIKTGLNAAGIKYIFMGDALGGRPAGAEFYDEDGYVLYNRVSESKAFKDGIKRLERGLRDYRVVVMCSEESPFECHRRLLIGRVLATMGIRMLHIRGSGSVQSEEEITAEEQTLQPVAAQLALLGQQEEKAWKSTRSVLRKGQPPIFTAR